MSFTPHDYLRHILAETDYLIERRQHLSAESFLSDQTHQRAFVRSLEIIGEAVKKLPEKFREQHPEVEWSAIAKTRDRLIHGYFAIDYELIWEVVDKKVPELRRQVAQLTRGSA